jgi:hypothetical protein
MKTYGSRQQVVSLFQTLGTAPPFEKLMAAATFLQLVELHLPCVTSVLLCKGIEIGLIGTASLFRQTVKGAQML